MQKPILICKEMTKLYARKILLAKQKLLGWLPIYKNLAKENEIYVIAVMKKINTNS